MKKTKGAAPEAIAAKARAAEFAELSPTQQRAIVEKDINSRAARIANRGGEIANIAAWIAAERSSRSLSLDQYLSLPDKERKRIRDLYKWPLPDPDLSAAAGEIPAFGSLLARGLAEEARLASQAQAEKAAKPRRNEGEQEDVLERSDGETPQEIIEKLAGRVDEYGDPYPASELWGEFYSALDYMLYDPSETGGTITYKFAGKNELISLKTFLNKISAARKNA